MVLSSGRDSLLSPELSGSLNLRPDDVVGLKLEVLEVVEAGARL